MRKHIQRGSKESNQQSRSFTRLHSKVSATIILLAGYQTFLLRIDDSEPDFGISCMHGPEECAGNVQQLCVNKYAPFENWWEFVICQNYQGREYIGEPDVALTCAKTAGIDWERSGAGQCAGLDGSGKGSEGVALLKESVLLAQQMNLKCVLSMFTDNLNCGVTRNIKQDKLHRCHQWPCRLCSR